MARSFSALRRSFVKVSSEAADRKMLVLRMEKVVSYMDQSGIYALLDVFGRS